MSEISEIGSGDVVIEVTSQDREEAASFLSKAVHAFATPFIAALDFIAPKNLVTGSRQLWYLPKSLENLMGRIMYPIMKANQGGETEHLFSETCRKIMQELAVHSKREFNYEVSVLNNNQVNAWCLPGGKVAVYKTLLEKIDFYVHNKDKLGINGYTHPESGEFISYADVKKRDVIAALLGHEMTHADARHSARSLEMSFLAQAAIFGLNKYTKSILDNWEVDLATRESNRSTDPEDVRDEKQKIRAWRNIHSVAFGCLTHLGIQLYFLAGSHSHELEADKYGTKMAVAAGYNPAGALFLQEILKQESKGIHSFLPESSQKIQSLFHSHPSSSDRQLALFQDVKAYKMGS
ncbi:M48 family metalloprotease [Candidatus Neptunichlamydia sp. REUL1]|uniref:M48 family metalloprotease n=1 Tax=Candidatus Neptunichlamydia sp. REUL1 TaxID=3064277 RepID=UPI00292DCB5F|nr:M48 family metalloprotease [Candidatus Neptunochlamydia sp. REUL1]